MNIMLLAPFVALEMEQAVREMFPTKAPEPDGFPAMFYQNYWSTVGPKTIASCLEILNSKMSIQDWNATNIVLISKCGSLKRVTDFRLISLCNVSYKIVTKVLANRLKRVLNAVISESQSAFILGRAISDNIIIGHECLHALRGIKSGREGYAALKLDMSKAYDQVEWSFLEKIMIKLGFAEEWVERIMHCISTVFFAINIHGSPVGRIIPTRGLRQGILYLLIFFFFAQKVCLRYFMRLLLTDRLLDLT